MAHKVLVIEDNQDMREAVVRFLESEGFSVQAYSSTEDGIDAVDENKFDIGLIDINLPGKSGFSMIEYIRDEGYKIPLIALTARDGIEDKLRGFDLGLTDYLVKPFNLKELKARIKTHLNSSSALDEDADIEIGKYKIKPKSMQFMLRGKTIELTQLEFRMMRLFMQNPGTMVKIDDLIEEVWGESASLTNPPVRIHIANLRKKIGDTDYQVIRTIPGTGYIFSDTEAVS
ncbi:MAG: response regulator transcription factor [Candidatus Saccharimonadales bacterium]|nr:response regulator transcription factor [Candidatus Saccharimonadales bacterium]